MATELFLATSIVSNQTMDNTTYYDDWNDTIATVEPDLGFKDRLRNFVSEPHKCIALALGCLAILLNVLSLLAISQIKNRITNHYRLIISLALSDIVIGVSLVLFCIHTIVNDTYYPGSGPPKERLISRCMSLFVKSLNSTGLIISLFNLLGMALDHYMAIIRPLHYPSLINGKKSYVFFVIAWSVAFILGFSDFLTGWTLYNKHKDTHGLNYCEACFISRYQDEFALYIVTGITTFAMIFIYIRLYIKIRNYRTPGQIVQSAHSRRNSTRSDIRRNKRALMTTLLILCTFMICWLPNCLLQVSMLIKVFIGKPMSQSFKSLMYHSGWYFYDLMLINSIADPIIYALRVFDVQLGYRRLMRKCCPPIKSLITDDYVLRTNLIDRKTSSLRKKNAAAAGQNGGIFRPHAPGQNGGGSIRNPVAAQNGIHKRPTALEMMRQGTTGNSKTGSMRQALVPKLPRVAEGESSGVSTSSSRPSNDVSVQRCQSAP